MGACTGLRVVSRKARPACERRREVDPLTDPGLLGAGPALAVVVGIYAFGETSLVGHVWFAFAAGVAVLLLGSPGPGGPSPVTALLGALTSSIILVDVTRGARPGGRGPRRRSRVDDPAPRP